LRFGATACAITVAALLVPGGGPGGTGRVPTNWAVNAVLRHDLGTLIGPPIDGAMMTYLLQADS